MSDVFLALGSNLGNLQENLLNALDEIRLLSAKEVLCSSFYQSEAHRLDDNFHPPYLNAVCNIETTLNPFQLLKRLKGIEKSLGRVETEKWGNRVLDIDILFFDAIVIQTESLTLPHPRIAQRRFVLEPLQEIAPNLVFPALGFDLNKALTQCTDNPILAI